MLQGYIRRIGWLLGGLLVSAVGIRNARAKQAAMIVRIVRAR